MSVDLNFDANTVKPNERPGPVPNGEYVIAMTASTVEPTKNRKGQMLKLEYQILSPEAFKGRKLWDNLCIQHENAQTQAIAQGQLSAICHATGVLQLKNSAQLHGLPMTARVVITQDKGYDPKNEIKEYKKLDGAAPVVPAAAAAATPAAAPTQATNVPAWAQKKSA